MKYSLISITLLFVYVKAKNTEYCWSKELGYDW